MLEKYKSYKRTTNKTDDILKDIFAKLEYRARRTRTASITTEFLASLHSDLQEHTMEGLNLAAG